MKIQFIRLFFFSKLILLLLIIVDAVFSQQTQVNNIPQSNANLFLRKLTLIETYNYSVLTSLNHKPHLVYYSVRNPRLIATILTRKNITDYFSDDKIYHLPAERLEFVRLVSLIKRNRLSLDFGFDHAGYFSRVNVEGKSVNAFPKTDMALGLHYSTQLSRVLIGFDARWIRSKLLLDQKGQIGHGYTYNLGAIYHFQRNFRMGAVLRNMSNGLSFADNAVPDWIERDILIFGLYNFQFQGFACSLAVDVNPPFKNGIRAKVRSDINYKTVTWQVGYRQHVDRRTYPFEIVEANESQVSDRIWTIEGITLGVNVRLGSTVINIGFEPQVRPVAQSGERIRIDRGRAVYIFSIRQSL
ncbi:TPA: hypothetical protein EYM26_01645 [Candidatus Poribacteria bacterium]|nr:hypothetical protein [Candidatus Poribacteria bacterium]